jgi:insertion element IS1 protein InsB
VALYTVKKTKLWLIKAFDRRSGRTIAWVLGGRDSATFRRLYDKVKHLTNCTFYTDNWEAFAEVLPPERHIIGKSGTLAIERNNSNTRHHLGRFTRRTKVVSKSRTMVDLTIRLWSALTQPEVFEKWQSQMLYLFR